MPAWDRRRRSAAGKREGEPTPPPRGPSPDRPIPDTARQEKPADVEAEADASGAVEAESFRLVNKEGNPRAMLTLLNDEPNLGFISTNGHLRLVLSLGAGGSPNVALVDGAGNIRARLGLGDEKMSRRGFLKLGAAGM